jgi:L-lactate dehydrogenase (cytochrome)
MTPRNVADVLRRPAWLWRFVAGPRLTFANFAHIESRRFDITSVAAYVGAQFDQALSWKDVEWLKSIFPGKLILKGIVRPEDARLARDHGADGLSVSNHGGRQLDTGISAVAALPAIAEAVGDDLEIVMDGGVRRGTDVIKALALGARACLIGRPFLYGLAAGGEAGVGEALGILRDEIDNVQTLLGCPDLERIDRSFLVDGPVNGRSPWPANR